MIMEGASSLLLKLPQPLRLRIVTLAGVPTHTEIYLNGFYKRLKDRGTKAESLSLAATHALLLTCRLLYDEVSALVFSTNLILFKPHDDHLQLLFLQQLRPRTVNLLRRFTIHANSLSGLPHEQCEKSFDGLITSPLAQYASRPLSLRKVEDEDFLQEWQAALAHILNHADSSKLSLHVICDCADLKTAEFVTRPFWDNSPNALADCALRLSQKPKDALSREAKLAAQHAMHLGKSAVQETPTFRFKDLPPEIRLLVLRFTDLVLPLGEVEWAPKLGYHFRLNWDSCTKGRSPYCGDVHYACSSVNCWQIQGDGCFCKKYHSAYSRQCNCWLYPTPLFLVSRAFKKEAERVFSGDNRFIVRSKRGFQNAAKVTPQRIAPTIFFNLLGDRLWHLKYLELVFPPIDYDYLRETDSAFSNWINSIDSAAKRLNLPHLTLFLVMADHHKTGTNITHYRYNMTPAQGDQQIEMYFRIIKPLQKFRALGLQRFFVSVAWPWRWTESGKRRLRSESDVVNNEIADLERRLEESVMGAGYDSGAMGKHDIQRTQWTFKYWEDFNMFTNPVDNSESEDDLDE